MCHGLVSNAKSQCIVSSGHIALPCRGYWANAVILLLSSRPSGGCSGLMLRPAGPADLRSHHPRVGTLTTHPDGSIEFVGWSPDSDDDEDDDSDDEMESHSSAEAPVSHPLIISLMHRVWENAEIGE